MSTSSYPKLSNAYMVDGFLLMAGALADTVIRDNWSDPVDMKCFVPHLNHWAEGLQIRETLLQVVYTAISGYIPV